MIPDVHYEPIDPAQWSPERIAYEQEMAELAAAAERRRAAKRRADNLNNWLYMLIFLFTFFATLAGLIILF